MTTEPRFAFKEKVTAGSTLTRQVSGAERALPSNVTREMAWVPSGRITSGSVPDAGGKGPYHSQEAGSPSTPSKSVVSRVVSHPLGRFFSRAR